MKPKWTGAAVAKMHVNEVTMQEIGDELNVKKSYICMILNGKRNPSDGRKRIETAIDNIIARRKEEETQRENRA